MKEIFYLPIVQMTDSVLVAKDTNLLERQLNRHNNIKQKKLKEKKILHPIDLHMSVVLIYYILNLAH